MLPCETLVSQYNEAAGLRILARRDAHAATFQFYAGIGPKPLLAEPPVSRSAFGPHSTDVYRLGGPPNKAVSATAPPLAADNADTFSRSQTPISSEPRGRSDDSESR